MEGELQESITLPLNADCVEIFPPLDYIYLACQSHELQKKGRCRREDSITLADSDRLDHDYKQNDKENKCKKVDEGISLREKTSCSSVHTHPILSDTYGESQKICRNEELYKYKECQKAEGNLVCTAMYQLIEAEKRKIGGLYLTKIKYESVNEKECSTRFNSNERLVKLYDREVHLPYGVLDIRCICNKEIYPIKPSADDILFKGKSNLACVSTECAVHFFDVEEIIEDSSVQIKCNETHKICIKDELSEKTQNCTLDESKILYEDNAIGVALDICNPFASLLAFSCSNGMAGIISDSERLTRKWLAHDAEVWTIAFDKESGGNCLYTGADDCVLKRWDTRMGLHKPDAQQKTEHTMGVTAIECPLDFGYCFATGSYDEYIRIFDKRDLKTPLCKEKASGGIWRVKSFKNYLFLANCFGGAEIWSWRNSAELKREAVHTAHESMVYGIHASIKNGDINHTKKKKKQKRRKKEKIDNLVKEQDDYKNEKNAEKNKEKVTIIMNSEVERVKESDRLNTQKNEGNEFEGNDEDEEKEEEEEEENDGDMRAKCDSFENDLQNFCFASCSFYDNQLNFWTI